ncbi:MAG: hypothetical protein N0E37_07060, partial [Candidatus Thiodiazotropha taylori]|nr:hypothetical protein [Candidatus Thiodiazotropha taylori]MCW4244181.1 hypothetical protein [Candidatus Thiodiazotropha taylori]
WEVDEGQRLIKDGTDLITHMARARVSMPKSTTAYLERCKAYLACRKPGIQTSAVELKSL